MELTLFFIIIYLALSFLIFQITFNRNLNKHFLVRSNDLKLADFSFLKPDQAWFLKKNPQDIDLMINGRNRKAYFLDTFGTEAETAIIVHGYTSQAISMSLFARVFVEEFHMNVLLIDLIAHGRSEGSLVHFGLGDYKDINLWVDKLNNLGYPQKKVCFGLSMGGATLLFASAHQLHQDVRAIIVDSGFIQLDEIFKRQATQIFKKGSLIFFPAISLWMKLLLGFSVNDVDVKKTLKKLPRPTLLMHGTADFFVPYTQSVKLHQLLPQTRLQLFDNSQHACSISDHRVLYLKTLKDFLLT